MCEERISKMYSAKEVARYIIDYSRDQMRGVCNFRLQKLLYFVQAEFLVKVGAPCFHEDFYAWEFGPVIREVYYEYKIFSAASIPSKGTAGKRYTISLKDRAIINEMVDHCAQYSTSQLIEFTLNQEPWMNAHRTDIENVIHKEAIKKFFVEV